MRILPPDFCLDDSRERSRYYVTAWEIHTGEKLDQQILDFVGDDITIFEDKVIVTLRPEWIRFSNYPIHHLWDLSSNHVRRIGHFSTPDG